MIRHSGQFKKGIVPWNKGSKAPYSEETLKKMRESHLGEKNYKYIKDRSLLKKHRLKMYDCQYKDWMLSVKNRDNWKCKISNQDCNGPLASHHILRWQDYPELRYDINNGITLCRFHHPINKSEEQRLSPYFKELIAIIK